MLALTRKRSFPAHDRATLTARLARYEELYDRLCNRNLILQVELRRLSKTSGRFLQRAIDQKARADRAEAALAAAVSRPATLARLLLRAERLFYRLSHPTCPSCHVEPPHRHNCRVEALLVAIIHALPIEEE